MRWHVFSAAVIATGIVVAASFLAENRRVIAQDTNPTVSPVAANARLTASEVVVRLEQMNRERLQALRGFQGTRSYRIEYTGPLGDHHAEMTVSVNYKSPGHKEFAILSESGSTFLCDHVLKRIVDAEKETASTENQEKTELNDRNFSLIGVESTAGGDQYVVQVTPKTDYKYLYRGKIWIDAKDFAVTKIEVEPAKNPSFWIKRSEINHRYEKVDNYFWLPAEDHTQSWIRVGGQALLSIDYEHYEITGPAATQ